MKRMPPLVTWWLALCAFGIFLTLYGAACDPTTKEEHKKEAISSNNDGGNKEVQLQPDNRPTDGLLRESVLSKEDTNKPDLSPTEKEATSEQSAPEKLAEQPPTTNVHIYPPMEANRFQQLNPTQPAPPLQPKLLALTYAGGAGNQTIRTISFAADGSITATGKGFSIEYNAAANQGKITGDPKVDDTEKTSDKPSLPGDPGKAYTHDPTGLTFRVGYRQAGGNLQMPIFRAFQGTTRLWTLWGHAVQDAIDKKLTADTRCYQAWGMPQGRIGVQCWTDGGNSVITKDPRDLNSSGFNPTWAQGAYQNSAGGLSSMYALVEPQNGGSVLSGTFVASHVVHLAVDAWGRVYLAKTGSSRSGKPGPNNPFGQADTASSGVLALSEDLKQAIFHARIGGNCNGGQQYFTTAALRDNILVLGGTTCAADLQTVQAAQSKHGGGQDAMLAILQLWPKP